MCDCANCECDGVTICAGKWVAAAVEVVDEETGEDDAEVVAAAAAAASAFAVALATMSACTSDNIAENEYDAGQKIRIVFECMF